MGLPAAVQRSLLNGFFPDGVLAEGDLNVIYRLREPITMGSSSPARKSTTSKEPYYQTHAGKPQCLSTDAEVDETQG